MKTKNEKYYRYEARKAGALPPVNHSLAMLAFVWDNKIRARAGKTGVLETASHFGVSVASVRAVLEDRLEGVEGGGGTKLGQ